MVLFPPPFLIIDCIQSELTAILHLLILGALSCLLSAPGEADFVIVESAQKTEPMTLTSKSPFGPSSCQAILDLLANKPSTPRLAYREKEPSLIVLLSRSSKFAQHISTAMVVQNCINKCPDR
jgi:hypothetical protein